MAKPNNGSVLVAWPSGSTCGNGLISVRVYYTKGCVEEDDMDTRDWELLDKQLRSPQPAPPPDGVMLTVLASIFILGVTTGALCFAPGSTLLPTAGDGTAALAFFQSGPGHETP
jgi:hypothetical protein